MASNTAKDVESFLNKVGEIESIVKGLNSGDDQELKSAMNKADEFLRTQTGKSSSPKDEEKDLPQTTTGFSKTVINKSSGDEGRSPTGSDMQSTDQNAFMAALEADANERAARRKVNEKLAQGLKEKGNQAFKENDFDKAVDFYTQALDKIRDNHVFYTNRAQALIKLEKYEEALSDCDWALRANPNAIKAYVHMGRAQVGLERYKEARESFNNVLTIDSKKTAMVQEYLEEVSRAEKAKTAEQKAEELFKSGDAEAQSVAQVLERLAAPDQIPMFYSGGFRLLAQQMKDKEDNKTQFRVKGGFQQIGEHKVLCRCLNSSPQSLSREEREVLDAAFCMFNASCINNDSNQEHLLRQEGFSDRLMTLLSPGVKGRDLKTSIINLLFTLSTTHHGRSLLIQHFCVLRLVSCLFDMIRARKSYSQTAASVLNNLSLEKKFRSTVREKLEDVLPSFEELLKDSESKSGVIASCITAMMNLAGDPKVRKVLANRRPLWLASEELLVRSSTSPDSALLNSVLGLVANLTSDLSPTLLEFGQRLCAHCRSLLPPHLPPPQGEDNSSSSSSGGSGGQGDGQLSVAVRALMVMGHVLPHSVPAVEWVTSHPGLTELLISYVKSDERLVMKGSLKCMTALTQFKSEARQTLVKNKGIPTMYKLLQTKEDESVVGNAALCLSHCTQEAGVCASLAETDIVKQLLIWARDGKKSAVQQNCAILLAKLANGHTKHYERLTELHGMQILHDCMKHVKS